jgi:hypothetical protein
MNLFRSREAMSGAENWNLKSVEVRNKRCSRSDRKEMTGHQLFKHPPQGRQQTVHPHIRDA